MTVRTRGGEAVRKLFLLGLVAGGILVYTQRSDIQRYLRIRNM